MSEIDIFQVLRCPTCRLLFERRGAQLICSRCAVQYPVIDGIPRILPLDEVEDNYSRNFQYYWLKIPWERDEFYRRRFYELTEWKPEDLQGKFILDAGAGGGRWTYYMAEAGATVVALDYTRAIEKARERCKQFDNVVYVQGDIYNLPFEEKSFDMVHCHGVIMATPNPKAATRCLASMVNPGGELAVLLYRKVTKPQEFIDRCICRITKSLPIRVAFKLCYIPTLFEYVPGVQRVFENIMHLSGQPDWHLKLLHNFDWYTCQYRRRQSPEEAIEWYKEFGFNDIKVLNTNEFRLRAKTARGRRIRKWALDHNLFLKATLGLRGRKI